MSSITVKACELCGQEYGRRPTDPPSVFARRRFCSPTCAGRNNRAQQVTQNLKEVVTYEGAHIRVRVARGDASGYACIDCGGHARQWALTGRRRHADAKGRPYSTDIDDYSPMCIRCHRWHDRTHCKRGHEFTIENTYTPPGAPNNRQCRTCRADRARMAARR